ncbi:piggyBac transposable element-derived protein 3-like [Metopolophium dirhodum]|uniref:piggyBac transposable element-derived protein 3-like n=1 Tax=Metopolophium dirhodum TaxID=44670 RepID=UPI00298FDF75|nr:piggyBac transposable element-derived protein 3-like [Metopolophium dirhodum]
MASFSKQLTVHEVTELLEQGDIDDILDDVTDMFMEPPVNVNNDITDEDSDDDGPIGDIIHMPASLLNAYIVIHDPDTENSEVASKRKLFFDQQVLKMIVDYSNNYASNKNQSLQIDVNELKCFLGILLLSGYNELSRRRMYWEKSPDTHNDLVSGAMRRNRFEFLIHTPHQQFHSIDESMVPYFGRHGCKQFIRGKPIRFGFKIWVGTLRLGYVVWISPYQGKSGDLQNTEYGLGASVTISYANNLLAHRIAPYHLVFDNFFTGLPLLEKLSEMGLYGTGTIRSNRTKKCPINLAAMKKKERGSYESYVSDSASNNIGVEPVTAAKRWSVSDKRSIRLPQPQLIHLYNQNMGGVDRMDQNVSQYRISIRGKKKWY